MTKAILLLRAELAGEHERRRDHDLRIAALIGNGLEALEALSRGRAQQADTLDGLKEWATKSQQDEADRRARLDHLERMLSDLAREQERRRGALDQLGADLERLDRQTGADLADVRRDQAVFAALAVRMAPRSLDGGASGPPGTDPS